MIVIMLRYDVLSVLLYMYLFREMAQEISLFKISGKTSISSR